MAEGSAELLVVVSPDKSKAWLSVPPDFPLTHLSIENCRVHLTAAGVEYSAPVDAAVRAMLDAFEPKEDEQSFLVAQRVDPVNGEDGSVEWVARRKGEELIEHEPTSHYDRSAFVMVKQGDHVATITKPTDGEDGRDVTGRSLRAKPGRAAELTWDDSLLLAANGQLIAQCDGVVEHRFGKARISQVLEVTDIDFASGNVEFDGNVKIAGKVRDRFVVKATGSVETSGLIEAATVDCGGDFIARGGMAGRGQGVMRVKGNAVVRFLDQVKGVVKGNLAASRELMACGLIVGHDIIMPNGAIIGGNVVVTGSVKVGSLGSQAGVLTRLIIGRVPLVEESLRSARKSLNQLKRRIARPTQKLEQFEAQGDRLAAAQKEQMTELLFELEPARKEMALLEASIAEMEDAVASMRSVHILITKRIYPNVRINVMGVEYRITKDIRGPVEVGVDKIGDPILSRPGAAPIRLISVATVQQPTKAA